MQLFSDPLVVVLSRDVKGEEVRVITLVFPWWLRPGIGVLSVRNSQTLLMPPRPQKPPR